MTDKPRCIYGVEAICREADIVDEDGEPHTRRAYYQLEKGQIPGAFKAGATWGLSVDAYRRARHGQAA